MICENENGSNIIGHAMKETQAGLFSLLNIAIIIYYNLKLNVMIEERER